MHLLRDPLPQADDTSLTAALRVIGVGSPQGDDAVGWQVVERLRAMRLAGADIALLQCPRPDSELLRMLRGARLAILVDAAVDATPGRVLRLDGLEDIEAAAGLSSHGLSPATMLRLGAVLGELPERLVLYAVTVGEDCALVPGVAPMPLSSAVAAGAEEAAVRIAAELNAARGTGT